MQFNILHCDFLEYRLHAKLDLNLKGKIEASSTGMEEVPDLDVIDMRTKGLGKINLR